MKSSIHKATLKQSSQRHLLWVGLHKEPSLKARLELLATNITVHEVRWQHVPNLGCRDAETARTITRSLSTWYNHVIVVSRAKPRTKGNRDDRRINVKRTNLLMPASDQISFHFWPCIMVYCLLLKIYVDTVEEITYHVTKPGCLSQGQGLTSLMQISIMTQPITSCHIMSIAQ